jgi:hypothetical protein
VGDKWAGAKDYYDHISFWSFFDPRVWLIFLALVISAVASEQFVQPSLLFMDFHRESYY